MILFVDLIARDSLALSCFVDKPKHSDGQTQDRLNSGQPAAPVQGLDFLSPTPSTDKTESPVLAWLFFQALSIYGDSFIST